MLWCAMFHVVLCDVMWCVGGWCVLEAVCIDTVFFTFFFALAMAMYFYHRKLAYSIALFGVAVGLARVSVGYHYPIDVIGGAILGMVVGYIGHRVYLALHAVSLRFRNIAVPLYLRD